MISKEALDKFKTLYKKHFEEELSDQVVLDKAIKLLNLMKIIYKPMTEEEYNRLQEKRKQTGDL